MPASQLLALVKNDIICTFNEIIGDLKYFIMIT